MRIALAACLLGAGLLPGRAAAAQPNGLWITNEQNVSLEAFMSTNSCTISSTHFHDASRMPCD